MGRAEDLFKQFEERQTQIIDELIAERRCEELYLDYKVSATGGKGTSLHNDDRKNLSKAISGFGNTEGGLIIWGVTCAKDPTLGDVPNGVAPIENPQRFRSWLESWVGGSTVPANSGVRNLCLALSGDAEKGFVVTLVPKSPDRPLRRLIGSEYYYMRTGSDFRTIPHDLLAGMFGRLPRPNVGLRWHIQTGLSGSQRQFQLQVSMVNTGKTLVRNLYLFEDESENAIGPFLQLEQDRWLAGGSDYPGNLSQISKPEIILPPTGLLPAFQLLTKLTPPIAAFKVKLRFGCEGSPLYTWELSASQHRLESLYTAIGGRQSWLPNAAAFFTEATNAEPS